MNRYIKYMLNNESIQDEILREYINKTFMQPIFLNNIDNKQTIQVTSNDLKESKSMLDNYVNDSEATELIIYRIFTLHQIIEKSSNLSNQKELKQIFKKLYDKSQFYNNGYFLKNYLKVAKCLFSADNENLYLNGFFALHSHIILYFMLCYKHEITDYLDIYKKYITDYPYMIKKIIKYDMGDNFDTYTDNIKKSLKSPFLELEIKVLNYLITNNKITNIFLDELCEILDSHVNNLNSLETIGTSELSNIDNLVKKINIIKNSNIINTEFTTNINEYKNKLNSLKINKFKNDFTQGSIPVDLKESIDIISPLYSDDFIRTFAELVQWNFIKMDYTCIVDIYCHAPTHHMATRVNIDEVNNLYKIGPKKYNLNKIDKYLLDKFYNEINDESHNNTINIGLLRDPDFQKDENKIYSILIESIYRGIQLKIVPNIYIMKSIDNNFLQSKFIEYFYPDIKCKKNIYCIIQQNIISIETFICDIYNLIFNKSVDKFEDDLYTDLFDYFSKNKSTYELNILINCYTFIHSSNLLDIRNTYMHGMKLFGQEDDYYIADACLTFSLLINTAIIYNGFNDEKGGN